MQQFWNETKTRGFRRLFCSFNSPWHLFAQISLSHSLYKIASHNGNLLSVSSALIKVSKKKKKAVLTLQGYNPGKRINAMGTARRSSYPWWNLAEQKALIAALLMDTPPTFPTFICARTHSLSLSFFFFPPSLHHSSWQLLHWRSKMIHTRAVFACPAPEDNNKLRQARAAFVHRLQRKAPDKNERRRRRRQRRRGMSNAKTFWAEPALRVTLESPLFAEKLRLWKRHPGRRPKHVGVRGWALCICICIKTRS